MMTVRKTWHAHGKVFTFTDKVSKVKQIIEDLRDYEMQYLIGYICYDTYIDWIRKYLIAMGVAYVETYEEV